MQLGMQLRPNFFPDLVQDLIGAPKSSAAHNAFFVFVRAARRRSVDDTSVDAALVRDPLCACASQCVPARPVRSGAVRARVLAAAGAFCARARDSSPGARSQFNELGCAQVQRSPPHTRPTTSASTLRCSPT